MSKQFDIDEFWKTVDNNKKAISIWPEWMQSIIITADNINNGTFWKKAQMKPKKLTNEQQLQYLRRQFKFNEDGTPDVYSFGEFKNGMCSSEIDDYLRVRSGKFKLSVQLKEKFNKAFGCQTCALARPNGLEITLFYRYDVQTCADHVFTGSLPLHWD